MIKAYERLHQVGLAHSVEAWEGDMLVGGLYGVSLGDCFFGESMFMRVSNASKVALVYLIKGLKREGFQLVDCQVTTEHLMQFGAREIPRNQFMQSLQRALKRPTRQGRWRFKSDGGIGLASDEDSEDDSIAPKF